MLPHGTNDENGEPLDDAARENDRRAHEETDYDSWNPFKAEQKARRGMR